MAKIIECQSRPNGDTASSQVAVDACPSHRLKLWQIGRVTRYIEDNLDKTISVANLASLAKLSKSHFTRCFGASFGMSPHAYVTAARLKRAHRLLSSTDAPLSAVALDCGLVDQSHLTKKFRQHTGITPGRWRRECDLRTGFKPVSFSSTATS